MKILSHNDAYPNHDIAAPIRVMEHEHDAVAGESARRAIKNGRHGAFLALRSVLERLTLLRNSQQRRPEFVHTDPAVEGRTGDIEAQVRHVAAAIRSTHDEGQIAGPIEHLATIRDQSMNIER